MKKNLVILTAVLFIFARFILPESALVIAGIVLLVGTGLMIYFGYYFSRSALRLYVKKQTRLQRVELLLNDRTGRIDYNTDEIATAIGTIRSILIENENKEIGATILSQDTRQQIDTQIDIIILSTWRLRHPPEN